MASQDVRELLGNHPRVKLGEIAGPETWWAAHYTPLYYAGYWLRNRYHPTWKPGWAGTVMIPLQYECAHRQMRRLCMDATRIADGSPVMLKRLLNEEGPHELEINQLFSNRDRPLASDPRNHCAPLLDVIQLPNEPPIMVHALLRPFYDPKFQTFGEFISFFAQICEGVEFMHENNVAHRDCTSQNIMLDPSNMYPESFHPIVLDQSKDFQRKAKAYSRTERPTRYLLVDFGHSRQYDRSKGPPLDEPLRGGDKSAPEHQTGKLCNPFPTDVYYLGNLVRKDYLQKYKGFEFMEPLIADMVQEDPSKRPTMDKVTSRFLEIRTGMSTWKLRSRMVRKKESWPVGAWRAVNHWTQTARHVLAHRAAIPEPR